MALIEQITKMKNEGLKEDQIATRLQEQGYTPREVNEAIDQSKVKSAVSEQPTGQGMQPSVMGPTSEDHVPVPSPGQPGMPPAMPRQPRTQYPQMPQPQQMTEETQYLQPPQPYQQTEYQEPAFEEAYPSYSQYPESQYPEYESPAQPLDTDMISEIAEQITIEKTEKLQKQIYDLSRFKIEAQGKIENIDERLKRIEMIIDRLQTAILRKMGEYGQDISDLKDEMITTQESFSKVLSKGKTKNPKTTEKRGRKKQGFEKYLRK